LLIGWSARSTTGAATTVVRGPRNRNWSRTLSSAAACARHRSVASRSWVEVAVDGPWRRIGLVSRSARADSCAILAMVRSSSRCMESTARLVSAASSAFRWRV
jgi:hypothetical protein